MKRTSLSFLTIIILILSSSCASLNQNSAKKAVTTAVKVKIDSRNYVIEAQNTYDQLQAYVHTGIYPRERRLPALFHRTR